MTRVNVIPVEALSDQWLLAEYHELPRVIKQDIDTSDAPDHYVLGKGHMKWAKKHSVFTVWRYASLCKEMIYRGFKVNYTFTKLAVFYVDNSLLEENDNDYEVSDSDLEINKQRLIEKYKLNPSYYKWTKRDKPWFIKMVDNPSLSETRLITLKEAKSISLDLKVRQEYPSWQIRWLVKKGGTKVLQQLYWVRTSLLEPDKPEWRDIKEIKDE